MLKINNLNKKTVFYLLLALLQFSQCDFLYMIPGIDELRDENNEKNEAKSDNTTVSLSFPQRIAITKDAECLVDFNDSRSHPYRVICKGGIYGDSLNAVIELPEDASEIKALTMNDASVCVIWRELEDDFYFSCSGEFNVQLDTKFDGLSDESHTPVGISFYNDQAVVINFTSYAIYYTHEDGAHRLDGTDSTGNGTRDGKFCISNQGIFLICGELEFDVMDVLKLIQSANHTIPETIEQIAVADQFGCATYTNTGPQERAILCATLFDNIKKSTGVKTYPVASGDIKIKASDSFLCVNFNENGGSHIECVEPQTSIEVGSAFTMDSPIFENKDEIIDFAVIDERVCIIEVIEGSSSLQCEDR